MSATDALPWQEDRPLWRLIVNGGYVHPVAMHLNPILIEHGHKEHATAVQEKGTRLLRALDDSPDWLGVLRYNTACHHALIGESEKAIAELREALAMNPGLTEWSKEDSDLASLRGMPEYEAIYGE